MGCLSDPTPGGSAKKSDYPGLASCFAAYANNALDAVGAEHTHSPGETALHEAEGTALNGPSATFTAFDLRSVSS